jgi:pimeloyl-ACP methyl ester carboxylesterase
MAKLGLAVMGSLAMAVLAASCDKGRKELLVTQNPAAPTTEAVEDTGYADVNGLHMYYEVHGSGEPVILLHGAYMSAAAMRPVWDVLDRSRKVIVPEAQGHAHTADIDRAFSYQAMADDVAKLMEAMNVPRADVMGYSMGAGTALQLAIRHPEKVKRLVVVSGSFKTSGMYPEVVRMLPTITPEAFKGSPMEAEYKKISPTPDHFPQFVEKLTRLDTAPQDWPASDIAGIKSPTMVMVGDQDVVKPEHAVEMLRLLGGGVPGDMGQPAPEDQLAILPGTTHVGMIEQRGEMVARLARDFIDPPPPPPPQAKVSAQEAAAP